MRWPRELAGARSPVLVVGAGTDDRDSWAALQTLAERLNCPVWQEAFGARAGYPQDHPLFAGHLPSGRTRAAQGAGRARRHPRGRRTGLPAVPARARSARRTGHPDRGDHRRPGRGQRGTGRSRRHRRPRRAVRAAGRTGCPPDQPRRVVVGRTIARIDPPAGGGVAATRRRLHRPGRADSAQYGDRRGEPVEPSAAARPDARPGNHSDSSVPRWAASASGCPPRSA